MPKTRGPEQCCILRICCRTREESVAALATELTGGLTFLAEASKINGGGVAGDTIAIAQFILDNFDLVPKGLGEAIVEAYADAFAEFHRAKQEQT